MGSVNWHVLPDTSPVWTIYKPTCLGALREDILLTVVEGTDNFTREAYTHDSCTRFITER